MTFHIGSHILPYKPQACELLNTPDLNIQRLALPWLLMLLWSQWSHCLYPGKLNNLCIGFAICELGVG